MHINETDRNIPTGFVFASIGGKPRSVGTVDTCEKNVLAWSGDRVDLPTSGVDAPSHSHATSKRLMCQEPPRKKVLSLKPRKQLGYEVPMITDPQDLVKTKSDNSNLHAFTDHF
jgi:hypothetical protein